MSHRERRELWAARDALLDWARHYQPELLNPIEVLYLWKNGKPSIPYLDPPILGDFCRTCRATVQTDRVPWRHILEHAHRDDRVYDNALLIRLIARETGVRVANPGMTPKLARAALVSAIKKLPPGSLDIEEIN